MLQSLELENFKAFGKRASISFAPITLIFGENSAGKSTVLQALNLLKQTRESREVGALLLPRAENGIVDLGSFQEMLFDHDLKRTLSIRVKTQMDHELAIEFNFKRPSLEQEVLLDQIEIYDGKSSRCLARFQPFDISEEPAEFSVRMGLSLHPFFRDSRSYPPSELVAVKCVWLTEGKEYWESEFGWCKKNKKEILTRLKERILDLESLLDHQIEEEKYDDQQKRFEDELQEGDQNLREDLKSLSEDLNFFSSDFDLKTYISKRRAEEMKTVLGLQGFLPVGIISGERTSSVTGPHSLLRRRADDLAFNVANFTMGVGRALEQVLKSLFPMGPFRRPPERWYIFTGTSPEDVGYRGDLLPDLLFRHSELVTETNEWLERLDMGYELEVKPVGGNSGDLFEVRLIDIRRKERVNVALPDVGFGVSQLLPFVVQSLVSKEQIISIEQPEVHVHPKLQADLGDLLAEAIGPKRSNQFIIETHSEHLILRLQRLVYEKSIRPEDVSVIYVSRAAEGAKSQRLHLDEEGDFIDEWPNGFFSRNDFANLDNKRSEINAGQRSSRSFCIRSSSF